MRNLERCIVLVAVVAAGSALAADFSVEFDETVDFSKYDSYAWMKGTPSSRRSIQNKIVQLVDRELQSHDLAPGTAHPDFFVVTHVLVDRQTLEELRDPNYWEFVTGNTAINAMDLGAGSLVVDLLDAETDKIVWRGLISGDVSGTVSKAEKKLDKAIARLFRDYPPTAP